MKYTKVPTEIEEQICVLKDRGLQIPDSSSAQRHLANIGYFRMTGYMSHLQSKDGNHVFRPGTTFADILDHYAFDKHLRCLVLEHLESIEVALRASLTNTYSLEHGFYWFLDKSLFDDEHVYFAVNADFSDAFKDPHERFIRAFRTKYTAESSPPSNMAMEVLSLGKLARLYRGLKNTAEKGRIAADFGLPSTVLSSWFIYLTNVRNVCAHHGRLWNRRITADRPVIPTRKDYRFNGSLPADFNTSMFGIASMVDRLLRNIGHENNFLKELVRLIDRFPAVETQSMGFCPDWRQDPPWKKDAA